ncbi:MAG: transglutaminase-like domain-containing protein [Bacillota bacterium]
MRKFIVSILTVLAIVTSAASAVVAVSSAAGDVAVAQAAGANAAVVANVPTFDTAKLGNGVIMIGCSVNSGKKLKVMIEKSGKKVTYDLRNDGTRESFPLQFGDGVYKVSVLENIEDTKYKYLATKNITLDLDDDNKVYLESVQNIRWNCDMYAIKKAAELTMGLKTDAEKIKAIYNFVISNISYDKDKLSKLSSNYVPDIENTIATGKGICYDYSSLLAAMLRSQGIPAKLVKGYSAFVDGYHAWNEIYDSATGKWITVDTTYDAGMKSAGRKFAMEKNPKDFTKVYEY